MDEKNIVKCLIIKEMKKISGLAIAVFGDH